MPHDHRPPGADDVPLFGEAPIRDVPEGPAPDLPRTGRRRRPDADEPEAPAPPASDVSSLFNNPERDLLAQLQAELAARERRPRPYRRARTGADPAPGGDGVNGHGVNGRGVNGHDTTGQDTTGQDTKGHDTNGQDTRGRDTNGQGNGPAGDRPPPDVSG
jgi:hypothetical protein